jgi:hypothetical protein
VNGQSKITTKLSVAIAGIFERYTYNIEQQDAPHKDNNNLFKTTTIYRIIRLAVPDIADVSTGLSFF